LENWCETQQVIAANDLASYELTTPGHTNQNLGHEKHRQALSEKVEEKDTGHIGESANHDSSISESFGNDLTPCQHSASLTLVVDLPRSAGKRQL
jgi:hypothetical protein